MTLKKHLQCDRWCFFSVICCLVFLLESQRGDCLWCDDRWSMMTEGTFTLLQSRLWGGTPRDVYSLVMEHVWHGEVRRSSTALLPQLCLGRPFFIYSNRIFLLGRLFFSLPSWPLSFLSLFLSFSSSSLFPLPLFFLFLLPCLIHARMPDWGRAFVHGHTFLHSWSGPMTLVVGLLQGATFLSNLPLVLFVSFIGPWQLERIKSHL